MNTTRTVNPDGSFTEVGTAQQSSIEISRNAAGKVAWSVKVYQDDPVKAADLLAKFLHIAAATDGEPK